MSIRYAGPHPHGDGFCDGCKQELEAPGILITPWYDPDGTFGSDFERLVGRCCLERALAILKEQQATTKGGGDES